MQPHKENKILPLIDLINQVSIWKKETYSIVFTNGCFDILHPGHIDYLEKAKKLGDKLIVGLNTDSSIKKNKGNQRPINDEFFRSKMLNALWFVDAIVFFNEETPYSLIQKIEPDILVKGSDYSIENIVGADLVQQKGGTVKTIDLLEGYSTTKIIQRIKSLKL